MGKYSLMTHSQLWTKEEDAIDMCKINQKRSQKMQLKTFFSLVTYFNLPKLHCFVLGYQGMGRINQK